MHSKSSNKVIVLFSIMIFFILGGIIMGDDKSPTLDNSTLMDTVTMYDRPKISNYWVIQDKVIDADGGTPFALNWAGASGEGWVSSGDGSFGNPYMIENVTFSYSLGYGSGLQIIDSSVYFLIKNCTFILSNNLITSGGLKLENTNNGKILNCTFSSNNAYGIYLTNSDNHTFSDNIIKNNLASGILLKSSNNNTFSANKIVDNSVFGILIDNTSAICDDNLFYNNILKNLSGANAYANGTNQWDNGALGNDWHDYPGIDNDDDGIGDTPYILPAGGANAQDNYPLCITKPSVTVNLPLNNTYVNTAPTINVVATDGTLQYVWYNVSNQREFLASGVGEALRTDIWNGLPQGQFIIEVFANDSVNNLNDTNKIFLWKDSLIPEITINSPANQTYWNVAPTINLGVSDTNLEEIWYNVSNQQEFLTSGVGEFLRTDIWSGLPEGQFIVELFANDTAGNINNSLTLELYKDSITPTVTISAPGNNTVWSTAPTITITANDINLEYIWYNVSNQQEFLVSGVDETLRADIWNGLPQGQFIIEVFANDSAGNINNTFTLSLVKDTLAPAITINGPSNNTYWSSAPIINIDALDPNLEYLWYNVSNQQEFLTSGVGEFLRADIWSGLSEGLFIIEIYANDTAGRLNDTYTLELYKDTLFPSITINSPGNNTQWLSAPTLNIVATDTNLAYLWYNVSNQLEFLASGVGETLRADIWSGLPQGQFIVEIYANDTAGHLNNSYILILTKDTIAPTITINSPTNNTFWKIAPTINIVALDPNLEYLWYNVSNQREFLSSGVGEPLRADIWTGLSEGQFIIKIYANDTVGRLNNTFTLVLFKDTVSPNITIVIPSDNQEIGINAPLLNFTIIEINLDTSWYTLNGGNTIPFTANGTMVQASWQSLWSTLSHGDSITITFYANDTAGNIGSDQVTVKVNNPSSDNGTPSETPGGIVGYDILLLLSSIGIISIIYWQKRSK